MMCVAAGCGFGGSDQVDVEIVDLGGPVSLNAVEETDLWLMTKEWDEAGQSEQLIRFDTQSGSVNERIPVPGIRPRVKFLTDEAFYIRVSSLVEGLPNIGGDDLLEDPLSNALIKVDRRSGTPIAQYPLEEEGASYFFHSADDYMWYVNPRSPYLIQLDLTTGQRVLSAERAEAPGVMQEIDGYLWWFDPSRVRKVDPATGEVKAKIKYPETRELIPDKDLGFVVQDGKYWISGLTQSEPDLMFEFDLETGEVSNPQPADEFPSRSIEVDGHRWECCYDAETPPPEDRE